MIEIASEPLGKNYVAHVLSRSFLVSYFCYILILIIPATILININYSWPQYRRTIIHPTLSYQAYQISCLNAAGEFIFNSNFQSSVTSYKTYTASVSAGVQGDMLTVKGQVLATNIAACSAQVYFNTYLRQSVNIVAHLPLNFVAPDNYYLISWSTKGTISFKSSQPLPQSSILTVNQTQVGTYPYSFSGNFRSSGSKTVVLDSKILYNYIDATTSSTTAFTFTADFQILGDIFMQEVPLIDKLRTFIPIFMYICMFLWWMVVNPLIDWMLRNKVYSAKAIPEKIKKE